jgi:AraC family transcriptional regulator of adaptative response/methylated-DNA-[protein]-cysteine methyltransferase
MEINRIEQNSQDYARIAQSIRYLEQNFQDQPGLDQVAAHVGLSEYHFQRLFTRWVGISPKRFLQYLTKEHARQLLASSQSVLEAALDSGLSGPGRLHDLFVKCDAVTPGEWKNSGAGLEIGYAIMPSPFGECLLAVTTRGICHLSFVNPGEETAALDELQAAWPYAHVSRDPVRVQPYHQAIFLHQNAFNGPIPLYLHGTNFQIQVWQALLRIPTGTLVTYEDIAVSLGQPRSARAVGQAVAANPVAVLIPCHRVIRKDGSFGGYHYGPERKKAILGWEWSQLAQKSVIE